jgi:hypothetical protein
MQPLDIDEFHFENAQLDDHDNGNDDGNDTDTTGSHSEENTMQLDASLTTLSKVNNYNPQQQRKRKRKRGRPRGRNHSSVAASGSNSDSEVDEREEEDEPDDNDEIWNQRQCRPKHSTRKRDVKTSFPTISPSSKVKDVEIPTLWGLNASTPTEQWKDSFLSPSWPSSNGAGTEPFLKAMPQKNLFQTHESIQLTSNIAVKSSLGSVESSLRNSEGEGTPNDVQPVESRSHETVDLNKTSFETSYPSMETHGDQPKSSSPTRVGSAQSNVEVMHPFETTHTSSAVSNSNRVTPEDGNSIRPPSAVKGLNRRKLPTITNKTTSNPSKSRFKLPISSPSKFPFNGQMIELSTTKLSKENESSYLQLFHQNQGMSGQYALKSQHLALNAPVNSSSQNYNSRMQIYQHPKQQGLQESITNWDSLTAGTTPSTTQRTRPKKRALEVEDDVAKALRDFVTGTENSTSKISDGQLAANRHNESSCDFENKVKREQWIHFAPLKALREGVPYHRLSLKKKIVMLEFLIDQLLSMDAFAAEFARRREIEESLPHPYGTWPTDAELENLENADECGVCNGEGELLCCDGCTASYHRQCLDIPAEQQPPEGKWLCPECRLVDPALLGPLRLGAKASLDWFTLADVAMAPQRPHAQMQMPTNAQDPRQLPFSLSNLFHNNSPAMEDFMSAIAANRTRAVVPSSNNTQPTFVHGVADSVSIPPELHGKQFLVIHGYLFCRPEERRDGNVELLPGLTMLKMVDPFDPGIKKIWPVAQVPQHEESARVHFPSARQYLLPLESYDPNAYHTKYGKAPMTVLMISGAATQLQQAINMDPESEWNMHKFHRLSDCLIRDFTLDNVVAKTLRTDRLLFDPYEHFKAHLTRLEMTLRRACLLNEFWEAGTERSRQEIWTIRVRKARTINRLAKLLLQLVDSTHPRAFGEGWFHNPLLKGDEILVETGRHFEDLPKDWSEQLESKKRLWDRISPESILRLCEKEKSSLEGFVQGIREHVSKPLMVSRSKRKQVKTFVPSQAIQTEKLITPGPEPTHASPSLEPDAVVIHAMNAANIANDVSKSETIEPPPYETPGQGTNNHEAMDNDGSPVDEGAIPLDNAGSGCEPNISHANDTNEENCNPDRSSSPALSTTNSADTTPKVKPRGKELRKSKKQPRSQAGTPASRRTRRSMGRFSMAAAEPEPIIQETPLSETLLVVKTLMPPAESIQAHIETCKLRKVPQIEKLVKGGFQKQIEWPICGRIPFAPVGNLSPQEMKRLGRNGGVVKAPYVAYQSNHEVGQVCFSHIWRRQTSQCHGFEDFWLQLRVLESFVDRAVSKSCVQSMLRAINLN